MSDGGGTLSGPPGLPVGGAGSGAERSVLIRRLPLIAFLVFGVMSVGAFFIVQRLKTANPVVWHNPHPRPSVFDPVAGAICKVDGHLVNFRHTYLELSPSSSGRIAVYVYPQSGSQPVATISSGLYMHAVPEPGATTGYHRFFWNGRESNGKLAPAGNYVFRFVLLDLDNHAVDLTDHPVQLVTSANPPHGGCFPVSAANS